MKFEVHATITELYYVEADNFQHALEIASDMTEPDDTSPQGFSYVRNLETNQDLIL